MYRHSYYNSKNEKEIGEEIVMEGFDPMKITNMSGFVYPKHTHPEKKVLAFLSGSVKLIVNGETYNCKKGDKVRIEGNTEHSAMVGPDGCVFFWSEKL